MTKLPLRYVNEYRDVRGKVRRYFRRRGQKKVPLPGLPGSEEFMRAYQGALIRLSEPAAAFSEPGPCGNCPSVRCSYQASDSFRQRRSCSKAGKA